MKKIQTVVGNKFGRLVVVAFVWGVILLTASAQFKPTLSNSAPAPRRDVSRTILPPPTITVFPTGSLDSSEGGRQQVIYVQGEDLWPWDEGQ
jgi:hypothetical protein